MADDLSIDQFDFELPKARIAQHPCTPRDAARLLVIGNELSDRHISDLPEILKPGDLLVVNDTKVIPVRLRGKRDAVAIEATLHKDLGEGRWRAFAKPGRRLHVGDRVDFADGFFATVDAKPPEGDVILRFAMKPEDLYAALATHGSMPLPPYIRKGRSEDSDGADYQTMFAEKSGAVAAPTAGLHFTEDLTRALDVRGVEIARLTLHVGAGTFLPVKVNNIADHKMHSEYGEIDDATVALVKATRARGGRVVAVGTTCARLLESAVDADGVLQPFQGETDIFMTPGFKFRVVDVLLTNFHLPRSTLFMLVSALGGLDRMRDAYACAIDREYRFYSYGDACLIFPENLR
ncbi:MAG: tRNA preQ1(34) S-adenosylmethionine ribosyltransferase-isomerase QueA [Alphaproteobacteria bacterium]|nr:tRNA preQ1(34) S-adenosylmethionine ribosyltransferase-isomerase QueA [Alphaproteobacteria bacterium]